MPIMRTHLIPDSWVALTLIPLLLSSCAVGPDYKRPAMTVPASFKEAIPITPEIAKQLKKAEPKDGAARGKWWEVFGDPDLNKLEEQVAINNQNVKAAEAAFRQARALVAESRSAYFPTLGANASATRNGEGKGSGNASGTTLGGTIRNSYSASLDASWVVDVWGRIRREVEASKAGAEASAADLAAATLSAQAELAIDYLSLRIEDEQKRLYDRTITAFAKALLVTQNQYKLGVAASSDMLQAKVQLEGAQAQAVDIGVARAGNEHAIAILIGKAPSDFTIPVSTSVPALPMIPVDVPSQLLERRPDIAGAERRVAAANAQIGVAEAAFFPDLTLSASGGYSSSALARWFSLPSRFWSIGPSLAETVFDAGLRAAQTEAAIAAYDQTVANYRQTVLAAFGAVEDNLAGLRIYAEEAAVLDSAVVDAQKSSAIFMNQYKAGIVSYLGVVTSQTAELNDELSALNVRRLRLTSAATLIENLGGGWNAAALGLPSITQGKATILSILPPAIDKRD